MHSRQPDRWAGVRMPDVFVTDSVRPAAGTTISVVDGELTPALRPDTVISIGDPGEAPPGEVDVRMTQIGPATLAVVAGGRTHNVEVELFRAENRYVTAD